MVLTTDPKEVVSLVTLTISMLCLMRSCLLLNALPESSLSWEFCYIYFWWSFFSATAPELYLCLYWCVCASYNSVCVVIFCMLYNIIVFCTSPCYFVLYLSGAWVIPSLHHFYICVCINMFVNVIKTVTAIFSGT